MLPFQYIYTENGNGTLPFVFCKRKTENGSLFSLVGKRYTIINIYYYSKRACLWALQINPLKPHQGIAESIF